MPNYARAPKRRRPRRIQKKIDKRHGLLHCDRQAIYILMLSDAMSSMAPLAMETVRVYSELGNEMIDLLRY